MLVELETFRNRGNRYLGGRPEALRGVHIVMHQHVQATEFRLLPRQVQTHEHLGEGQANDNEKHHLYLVANNATTTTLLGRSFGAEGSMLQGPQTRNNQ